MSQRATIDSLTGLRGIAVLLVVMNHYFYWCSPYKVETVPFWISSLFSTSNLGMTLFFTLSGFVITYNYLDFDWGRSPFATTARFIFLRFSRLYPTLVFFILLIVANNAGEILKFIHTGQDSFFLWIGFHLFSVETWLPVKFDGALPIDDMFHVSWSISTEFMLYLMFAAAMIIWFHFARSRTCMLILAALATIYVAAIVFLAVSPEAFQLFTSLIAAPIEPLTDSQWRRWFFDLSPYFQILNFAIGAWAALLVLHRHNFLIRHPTVVRNIAMTSVASLIVFQFIVASGISNGYPWMMPFYQLAPAAMFSAVMLNGETDTILNRFLSSHSLVFLGKISYSLYLFHFLLPRLATFTISAGFAWKYMPLFVMNFVITLFLAIVFAAGMYRLIELPAQKLLRRLLPASKHSPH